MKFKSFNTAVPNLEIGAVQNKYEDSDDNNFYLFSEFPSANHFTEAVGAAQQLLDQFEY